MTFALTAYPVSQSFRDELSQEFGEIEYHSIPELRRLPPREMLRRLRRHRGERCLVPLEDPNSHPLVPLLAGVALVASPSEILLVGRDGHSARVAKPKAAAAVGRTAVASLDGRRAHRRARHELHALAATDRLEVGYASLDELVYLNANLWFGVIAGGSIGHTAGVANGLADRGIAVTLATISPPPDLRESVRVLSLQPPSAYGLPIEVNYLRFQHAVPSQVRRELVRRPDAIYQRLSVESYCGVTLSRSVGVPLILEYNGSEAWAARHWGESALRYEDAAVAAEDVSLHHAHLCVTVSDVLGDELRERGVAPERILVRPNGVDPVQYDPARFEGKARDVLRARYGIPADAIVVGFIGTFGRWHGVERLAAAAQSLIDDDLPWVEQKGVRFLLVGDGLGMREVHDLVGGSPYSRFVTLAGLVPQTEGAAHLAAADILVSPHVPNENGSPFFGSPTKLFEYMAMGRAIVASDLAQIGDVLRAGKEETALLTPPGDVGALASAIRRLVDDAELRSRLGNAARASAVERYTWQQHVDAIVERANELLQCR